jgi:hypothetical protein
MYTPEEKCELKKAMCAKTGSIARGGENEAPAEQCG